jgi:hypothetical protein
MNTNVQFFLVLFISGVTLVVALLTGLMGILLNRHRNKTVITALVGSMSLGIINMSLALFTIWELKLEISQALNLLIAVIIFSSITFILLFWKLWSTEKTYDWLMQFAKWRIAQKQKRKESNNH